MLLMHLNASQMIHACVLHYHIATFLNPSDTIPHSLMLLMHLNAVYIRVKIENGIYLYCSEVGGCDMEGYP